MSNNGPNKPIPFTSSYEEKQGLYYSLPASKREILGKKFTKEISQSEHVSGLKSLNKKPTSIALAAISEVDEESEASAAAAPTSANSSGVPSPHRK